MKYQLTIADIRAVVREGLKMYHGSPYRGLKSFTDFRGRIPFIFFTPDRGTAVEYSRNTGDAKVTFARHDPGGERVKGRTIYRANVDFPESTLFDTGRNPEHEKIYNDIQKAVWKSDPEEIPVKLMSTPDAVGGYGRIMLPSWSQIQKIFPLLAEMGFRGIWFSEGPQGPSLAIRLQDASSVHIEDVSELEDD